MRSTPGVSTAIYEEYVRGGVSNVKRTYPSAAAVPFGAATAVEHPSVTSHSSDDAINGNPLQMRAYRPIQVTPARPGMGVAFLGESNADPLPATT